MSRSFIQQQENNVYINASIFNNTEKDIPCEYTTTFNDAIVQDAGEFYLTIIRFDIPNTLPIFEFQPDTYYITLSYNGNDYTEAVTMYNVDAFNPSSRNIYSFQQFVDMINNAFDASFTALKTANPAAEAPFMVYSSETDFFSLYTQQLYDPVVAGGPTIDIFFNYDMYRFFYNSFKVENFGVNLPSQKDYRFIISDQRNNVPISPANYYEMKQQVITLFEWYDFQRIIFTASDLPVSRETFSARGTDGKNIEESIVTDFIPEIGKDRSNFIYNANPYRLIDLNGLQEIKRFNFKVSYIKKGNGQPVTLTLPPQFSMSVKFGFIRKEKYQNKYI